MSEILIHSKITAPRLHDKIVHRERLTKLLDENINKNLLIICSPAGFGKTTIALDFIAHQDKKYIWFGIPHRGIQDVSTFFEYLINALKNINKNFGPDTTEIMKSFIRDPNLSKEIVSVLTAAFVNEFHKVFKDDIIIVIDDLHYIDSEDSQKWLNELFNELIKNIPVNMHLLLISRRMPDFNLTYLNSKRNLFIVRDKELNFEQNEIARLLENVYGYKYDNEDVKLLEDKIKGWVTGIHLLLQAYGQDFNKIRYTAEISPESIFDFFAHEIFANLTNEFQEFLIITSLLENFNSDICNHLIEIKHSNEIIQQLINKNLFIQPVPDKSAYFTYHALFRNFLNSKLNEIKTEEEIICTRKKIAEYYFTTGHSISAINYFLESKDFEKAIPLLKENFMSMLDAGKISIVTSWLDSIPEEVIDGNAHLLYFLGILNYNYFNDSQKALSYLNKALQLLHIPEDQDLVMECYGIKTLILSQFGKGEETISLLNKIPAQDLKPENKAKLLKDLAISCRINKPVESIELLNQALLLCNEDMKIIKRQIYNVLGVCYFNMGDAMKSAFYSERVLGLAEAEPIIKNSEISNSVLTYSNSGLFNKSKEYLDKAYKLLENVKSNFYEFELLRIEAYLSHQIGDFEESIRLNKKLYDTAAKNNLNTTVLNAVEYLIGSNYYLNERNLALEYLSIGRRYEFEHYKLQHDVQEAALLTESKLNPSAEEKLLNAYAYFAPRKLIYHISRTTFYLANYYLRNNIPDTALNYLKISLEFASEYHYWSFFENELLKSRLLFDFALSRPELVKYKDFIKIIFSEVFNKLKYEWLSDECKARLKVQIENLYDIKMICFGKLEFKLRGGLIPESTWGRKKSKLMLAYIMQYRKSNITKDKLIDVFFPEGNPESAAHNFRQVLVNLRKALEIPHLDILISEGNRLSLNADCYYKSDMEEFDKFYKTAFSPEKNIDTKIEACKRAIGLYNGEFLEGYYEQWVEDLRQEYVNKYISVSELLLSLLKELKNYEEVIASAESLLKYYKLSEEAYLSLIESYVKLDKNKSARETYKRMLKTYDEELGEKPRLEILNKMTKMLG